MDRSPADHTRTWRLGVLIAVLAAQVVLVGSNTDAAFPGTNGKIAFWRAGGGISTVTPEGDTEQLTPDWDRKPSWSPNGEQIAFESTRDGRVDIWVMNADGTEAENLTPGAANGSEIEGGPAWSPDGSQIVFERWQKGSWDIWVMSAAGTGEKKLTTDKADNRRPVWSPLDDRIAFGSNRSSKSFAIHTMKPDGKDIKRVTNYDQLEGPPDWSPDGQHLAFLREEGRGKNRTANIWRIEAGGLNPQRLTGNTGDVDVDQAYDSNPAWSPDGKLIAFASNRGGTFQIHVMLAADGSGVEQLTFGGVASFSPDWQAVPGSQGGGEECEHWESSDRPDNPNTSYFATPSSDLFYAQPSPMPCEPLGTVLESRPVTFTPLPGVQAPQYPAWQLKLLSTDSFGDPIAVTAIAVKPTDATGPPKLLAFQHPYNSLGSTCHPSFFLAGNSDNGQHAYFGEQMLTALDAGWTVIATDWTGHLSGWGPVLEGGRMVLDSARAAEAFAPLDLAEGERTPVGLVGFSGSSPPTYWASMLLPTYAPELNVAGMVTGGTLLGLEAVGRRTEGDPVLFAASFSWAIGATRSYPDFFPQSILNAKGRATVEAMRDGCESNTTDDSPRPSGRWTDYTTVDDPLARPGAQEYYEQVEPLRSRLAPAVATYIHHGIADTVIPVEFVDELRQKWCDTGVTVAYNRFPSDHFGSWPLWEDGLRFIQSRIDNSTFTPTPTTRVCN